MDILNLINEIQVADPEFADRISPRRAAIKNITSFGSKVAVAALPFAFGTLLKKAYGQTATPSVAEILNFALTAELTEACFYNTAVARIDAGLLPVVGVAQADLAAIRLIQADENNHVTFVKQVLSTMGGVSAGNNVRTTTAIPVASGTSNTYFDFSGGATGAPNSGPFAAVFSNYDLFLAVAQAFEDTGVRAYKGQAGFLKGNQVVLTAALNIHSVEARHASYLRRLRALRPNGPAALRPWVTGDSTTASGITAAPTAVDPIYAGEANVIQGGLNIGGLVSVKAAQEAFDEPLTSGDVVSKILVNFLRTA